MTPIDKYLRHLPECNINANWLEADQAMADTPNEFRDESYYIALEEIQHKKGLCTCGLDEARKEMVSDAVGFLSWYMKSDWIVEDFDGSLYASNDGKIVTTSALYTLYKQSKT